jgi:hypothetical protein
MKMFGKLMLTLLVLAVLAPFTILKNSEGRPLMSFSSLSLPDFDVPDISSVASSSSALAPSINGNKVDKFYKWYDASGTLQFTTEPPPDGIDYSVKEFDPDTNLIRAVSLPVEEEVKETTDATSGKEPALEIGSPYNPDDIKKLLEDAQNIEKKLQQRFEDQNSALN